MTLFVPLPNLKQAIQDIPLEVRITSNTVRQKPSEMAGWSVTGLPDSILVASASGKYSPHWVIKGILVIPEHLIPLSAREYNHNGSIVDMTEILISTYCEENGNYDWNYIDKYLVIEIGVPSYIETTKPRQQAIQSVESELFRVFTALVLHLKEILPSLSPEEQDELI